MAARFQQVSFGEQIEPTHGALIRVFRRGGRVVATVSRYEWFDPEGNKYTGYIDFVEHPPRPAAEVFLEFKKIEALVALESDDLWDATWGHLMKLSSDT